MQQPDMSQACLKRHKRQQDCKETSAFKAYLFTHLLILKKAPFTYVQQFAKAERYYCRERLSQLLETFNIHR